jgi:hypothetical protein
VLLAPVTLLAGPQATLRWGSRILRRQELKLSGTGGLVRGRADQIVDDPIQQPSEAG